MIHNPNTTTDTPNRGTPPRLVASDIDGTFIRSDECVSPRLRDVINKMTAQGTVLCLATGRPPRWIAPVLQQIDVRPVCVCANGAITYDARSDSIINSHVLNPDALNTLVDAATTHLPNPTFAVERVNLNDIHGCGYATGTGGPRDKQFVVDPRYDHAWDSDEHGIEEHPQLLEKPAVKLLIRCEHMHSADMYALLEDHIDPALAHATYSIPEGLIECAAPGVNKAAAVAEVAEAIGIDAHETIAFGDMPNDIEMLRWAGTGVAMGNAQDNVKQAANKVTATNDQDGVAAVLETWF